MSAFAPWGWLPRHAVAPADLAGVPLTLFGLIRSPDGRGRHLWRALAQEEDAGEAGSLETEAGLCESVDSVMRSSPVRSFETKKMAPPPSLPTLSRTMLPARSSVYRLPSRQIAPPLPPPGVPKRARLAPKPTALLSVNRLL